MAEYIEREAFIKTLKKTKKDCEHYPNKVVCDFAIKMANLMPPADVQKVVRCKDCRWRSTEECAMYYRCNGGEYSSEGKWKPSKSGLGMGHVFDVLNGLYGDDFMRYK